ncbi:hypothetical protein [Frankia sp. Cj3]|uniref:hypothetical protein n=1 Tax=Frankia sp. Cj3 TaxID=2880976 RepID=UPI001EF54E24|nr:hypothetical protein [Frankia sp. Cj3]
MCAHPQVFHRPPARWEGGGQGLHPGVQHLLGHDQSIIEVTGGEGFQAVAGPFVRVDQLGQQVGIDDPLAERDPER